MKTILVYNGQPILDIIKSISAGKKVDFGVYRDRYPDNGWGEIRQVNLKLSKPKKEKLTNELKLMLLGDLAFVYGNNTSRFEDKLKKLDLL